MTIDLNVLRRAYANKSAKDASDKTLPAYTAGMTSAHGETWATVAKMKAATVTDAVRPLYDALVVEREAFYVDFEAGYKGDGKWKDHARVYWNRMVNHALPKREAGATAERSWDDRVLDDTKDMIKAYHRLDIYSQESDVLNEAYRHLVAAFELVGGDIESALPSK